MKKMLLVFIIFSGILLISSSCTYEEVDFISCETDEDCIKVPENCCTCSMGGSLIAVNKNTYISPNCENFACLAVISNHWTCKTTVEAKCINNQCTLINNS